jgi:hypothetical protein
VAEIRRLKPTKAKTPKRWNTLRISAWGFWVGLIYGVVDQFFLSDSTDDFLSEDTAERGLVFEGSSIYRMRLTEAGLALSATTFDLGPSTVLRFLPDSPCPKGHAG